MGPLLGRANVLAVVAMVEWELSSTTSREACCGLMAFDNAVPAVTVGDPLDESLSEYDQEHPAREGSNSKSDIRHVEILVSRGWGGLRDLNPRPSDPQSDALTS
jgi:hypothetical protein